MIRRRTKLKITIIIIIIMYNLERKGLEESWKLYYQVLVICCRVDNVRWTGLKFDTHLGTEKKYFDNVHRAS